MTAEDVLAATGEERLLEEIRPGWEEAMAALPEGSLPFLQADAIPAARQWSGLDDSLDRPLLDAAKRISDNRALRCLAWYYYWRIFESSPDGLKTSPGSGTEPSQCDGLFSLLIALALVPRLREYHHVLRIPQEITRETAGQIACICANYGRAHKGRPGVFMNQLIWLRNYINGNIYLRIGRFEYWLSPFRGGVVAYRHRRSGRVIALAEAGQSFSREGYLNGEASVPDDPHEWVSSLKTFATELRGHPVRPQGTVSCREIALPAEEWQAVLKKGDWVLDIHIPAGGNMSLESCRDSLARAADFFNNRFGDRRPVAFSSLSWIFSPQLEKLLPADSNLVQLQRELYLYPWPSVSRNIWFVFLQESFDPDSAPRHTSLQRVLADYLAAGHVWRNQAMFLLLDDLPGFGRKGCKTAAKEAVIEPEISDCPGKT